MSRGFVKEEDQEDVPLVPKRAYLPDGIINFVTPRGMEQLLAEKESLIHERDSIRTTDENEKRVAINFLNAKLQLLTNRIAEARIIDPADQPADEVRFGATVNLMAVEKAAVQSFQIVGVDEADVSKGKLSFISPLAKLLINKKTGEKVTLKSPGQETTFKILKITYE